MKKSTGILEISHYKEMLGRHFCILLQIIGLIGLYKIELDVLK